MSDTPSAKILSTKIEFGKFKPNPNIQSEPSLPKDYGEILRASCVLACALVPASDGDEYHEDLVHERQRIGNGIMKMEGYLHTEPAASTREILALFQSPQYHQWLSEAKKSPNSDYEERLGEQELAEIEMEYEKREQLWRECSATLNS